MSAYRHILLGLDLSVESHQVVDRAAALRDAFGSELSVIHVIEPLSFAYGGDIPMDFSGIQEEIHKQAPEGIWRVYARPLACQIVPLSPGCGRANQVGPT